MKSEFLMAITQLAAEKNLPKEVILSAVETALVTAYKKESFSPTQNISVKINRNTGEVKVYLLKTAAETVADPGREIPLPEAKKLNQQVQVGEVVEVEATPQNAGRIAAQTAKQVVLQRLREAEHDAIFEEYHGKEADIVSGIVQRIEPKQIVLELGRTQGILPLVEQVRGERYRVGQRMKLYLMEVVRTPKGPQVLVSRAHRNLLRRLLELEVPEIFNGLVEVKAIAREAGFRSKVAVAARQPGIDPVGCCVGQRGIRIQNIVNELNGEKIDIVLWDAGSSAFVANALSPAQVLSVNVVDADKAATVVVPDRQLSLAIGKDGQNARLAAKLTGWRIDIKSSSAAEAEKAPQPEVVQPVEAGTEAPLPPAPQPVEAVPVAAAAAPAEIAVPTAAQEPRPVAAPEPVTAAVAPTAPPQGPVTVGVPVEEAFFTPKPVEVKSQLRFAEDLQVRRVVKPEVVGKKPKKRGGGREEPGAGGESKAKKVRRKEDYLDEVEEELGGEQIGAEDPQGG
ncbi:MAG: transcription termination/antitermination protein NusA [Chloroflexi bacterium]|nr:transcription termination/antitermination protein NusA [Chloroflexota bacterium]